MPRNWSWPDIKAELERKGTSIAALARRYRRHRSTLCQVKTRPSPKNQLLLAKAIGVEPHVIWPGRYDDNGNPKSTRTSDGARA